jgi:antitoxin component of MazEF toxin-antitoxin module
MRKTLIPIGNSFGLVIDRPILELLKMTRDTVLELTTDGRRLIIEPAEPSPARPATAPLVAKETEAAALDYGDPSVSATIVDTLVDRFHMDNERFGKLHHARNYDNTFKRHLDYCAAHTGRFQTGGTNERTARRLDECLRALQAGHPWEAAIEIASKQHPR